VTLVAVYAVEAVVLLTGPRPAPIDLQRRYYLAGVFPTLSQAVVHCQTTRVLELTRAPDVVILGDSSATFGCVPKHLEELTALTVENVGLVQPLGVDGSVDLLQRYLEQRPTPSVVVYHYTDGTLAQSAGELERLGALVAFRSWLGVSQRPESRWPSFRLRPIARRAIGALWYQPDGNVEATCSFMAEHRGFVRSTAPWTLWRSQPRIAAHADGFAGIERLFELTAEHGIRLLVSHSIMPAFYDSAAARVEHEASRAGLRAIAAGYPHVVIDMQGPEYRDDALFTDYHHPTLEGALVNSARLADQLLRMR